MRAGSTNASADFLTPMDELFIAGEKISVAELDKLYSGINRYGEFARHHKELKNTMHGYAADGNDFGKTEVQGAATKHAILVQLQHQFVVHDLMSVQRGTASPWDRSEIRKAECLFCMVLIAGSVWRHLKLMNIQKALKQMQKIEADKKALLASDNNDLQVPWTAKDRLLIEVRTDCFTGCTCWWGPPPTYNTIEFWPW